MTNVISRWGNVRQDIMSIASVTVTDQKFTTFTRADTLADTTSTADAITTQANVQIGIIRLTDSAIDSRAASISHQRVWLSAATTTTRLRPAQVEPATTKVSTVLLDLLLIDAIALRIVRRHTVEQRAGL